MKMTDNRNKRQTVVAEWCKACFGVHEATFLPQRGMRLVEEAVEAAQAAGITAADAHRVVDHVFGRPVGDLRQELGGVGVTLLALANAAGLSADEAEVLEVERVLSKPTEHFQKRNAEKNAAGLVHLLGGVVDDVAERD